MRDDLALVRGTAMFEHVKTLPRAQHHLAIRHRDRQGNGHHSCLDMRRHIVRAFVCVPQVGHGWVIRGRDQTREERLQIRLNLRVGVFLDQQRTGRVAHKQGQQTAATCLPHPFSDRGGELIKPRPIGRNQKLSLQSVPSSKIS